jgi:hypothetical protein
MARQIQAIRINPPIAIARVGASTVPVESYYWSRPTNPRWDGETTIVPDWTLEVAPDGSLRPALPESVAFRDGDSVRPVAPFFELLASLGEEGSEPDSWTTEPLTVELLRQYGPADFADNPLRALTLTISAMNRKAARRSGAPLLEYGTFPPLTIGFNNFSKVMLQAGSPLHASSPLIPRDRHICLGYIQIIRPGTQPDVGATAWSDRIRVDTLRFRFTPGAGHSYGPPGAAVSQTLPEPWGSRSHVIVRPEHAFLNQDAGWYGVHGNSSGLLEPYDTYDGAERDAGMSLGIVDDTCEARVQITLRWARTPDRARPDLTAHCNVWVGPPDFAPDRRPFLSVADEINDRQSIDVVRRRDAELNVVDLDAWVQDLFEKAYEVVSLMNVDFWRNRRASPLVNVDAAIAGDQVGEGEEESRSMSSVDPLRNKEFAVPASSELEPLPLSEHARTRHRALSDVEALKEFIVQHPGRLEKLLRVAFTIQEGESAGQTTMQMPPFMRQSNAMPLTLSVWQYELLMSWVHQVEAGNIPMRPSVLGMAAGALKPLSSSAQARRDAVLAQISQ